MSSQNGFTYPIHINVQYNNNAEYRQALRDLFKMDQQFDVINNDMLDDISKDEQNFDEKVMKKRIEWVLEQTKDCYELNELYKLAAATMITLDLDTGLSVLFSFDYFDNFHQILVLFFKYPNKDLELFAPYERLWNRLSSK